MASKKLNNKSLIYIFLGLLIAVVLLQVFKGNKNERSFKSMVIEIDTAAVSQIMITTAKTDKPIQLMKENGRWMVESEEKSYNGDKGIINGLIQSLNTLKTERIAATKPDKWEEYEVTDSLGTRVRLMNAHDDLLADVIIGKFNFKQIPSNNPYQRQPATKTNSFVRNADDDVVYSVDGFLKMSFQPDINAYRDKKLLNVKASDIKRLSFSYPADSGFLLQKQNGQWMLNGLTVDSVKMASYTNKIARLMSGDLLANETQGNHQILYSLKVEGDNFSPVTIQASPAQNQADELIITSTANPGTAFSGKKNGLSEKIYISKNSLTNETTRR